VVAEGTLTEVLGDRETRVRVDGLDPSALGGPLAPFPGATLDGGDLVVPGLDPSSVPDLVAAIVALGGRIHAVSSGQESLERRFLELVGHRDEGSAGGAAA
jgi:hypothetical protein